MNVSDLPNQSFRHGFNKYIPTTWKLVYKATLAMIPAVLAFAVLMWLLGAFMGATGNIGVVDTANELAIWSVILILPFLIILVFYALVAEKIKTSSLHDQVNLFGSDVLPKTVTVILAAFCFVWHSYFGTLDIWTFIAGYVFVFLFSDYWIERECKVQDAREYVEFFEREHGIFIPNADKIKSTDEVLRIVKAIRVNDDGKK